MDSITQDMEMQAAQQNMQQIFKSPNCVCSCGCKTFQAAFVLKKISSLISPTGKSEIYPIPTYICTKCGKIVQEFLDKPAAKYLLGEDNEQESTTIIK